MAQVLGFLKGKTAIHIARVYTGRRRDVVWGSSSGRVATGCPRWDGMKSRCVAIFRNRKKKISGWIN